MKLRPKLYSIQQARATCPPFAAELTFPNDITALDSSNVSRLMGRFTQMLAWAMQLKADADLSLLDAKAKYKAAETQYLIKNSAVRNMSQRWRIDFVLDSDPVISAAHKNLQNAEAAKITATNMVETFDRYIWVLSRELSRKTASRDNMAYEQFKSNR